MKKIKDLGGVSKYIILIRLVNHSRIVLLKIHAREKLEQKTNEKIQTIVKIQENFQQSVQQQIKEDIEETIQEELENNLEDNFIDATIRDDSPKILVTGVSNKTGLVNDSADQSLHDPNKSIHEYVQENFPRGYHVPERGSYFDRPRRPRGGPRGRRGSYRARSRPYKGLPSRNLREDFPRRRNFKGHYLY